MGCKIISFILGALVALVISLIFLAAFSAWHHWWGLIVFPTIGGFAMLMKANCHKYN